MSPSFDRASLLGRVVAIEEVALILGRYIIACALVESPAACIKLTLDTARTCNFPLNRLIFEITEGQEVIDKAHLRGIVEEYRRRGFNVALDDFGAGYSTWPNKIAVAVNVSAVQFESPAFIASVEKALQKAGLGGSRLEVEVTEEILIRSTETARSKLDFLRKMGVQITMDSFGTGLASLSHLVQFPFNKIKIDRTLVTDGPFDSKSHAILRAVSALGQSLGIATLATGVETREHLSRVQQEGCQSVQGFFYSAAVPAKGLDDLIASFAPDKIDCRFKEAS